MGLLMWPNVMTHVWMWPGPVCNHVGCCRVLAHRSIFRVWAMIALILYVWVCGCVDVYDIDPWFPVFFITTSVSCSHDIRSDLLQYRL